MSEISTTSVASSSAPRSGSSGGARLLASDLRLAAILINEARYRSLDRLFGCSKDQANLLTLVVALGLAEAVQDGWLRVANRRMTPSRGDALLGMASVRELMLSVVGPSLRDKPYLGALITAAFVARATGPPVMRSIRAIRTGSQRLNEGFRRRYGYVIDPGHWRQQRYEARARGRAA